MILVVDPSISIDLPCRRRSEEVLQRSGGAPPEERRRPEEVLHTLLRVPRLVHQNLSSRTCHSELDETQCSDSELG